MKSLILKVLFVILCAVVIIIMLDQHAEVRHLPLFSVRNILESSILYILAIPIVYFWNKRKRGKERDQPSK